MIKNVGIVEHHAIYVAVTVVVRCTSEVFEKVYGPQPWDEGERSEYAEAHFDVTALRVPCKGEQMSIHVLPGDHETKSLHAGSYLRIIGDVELVEHQVYTRGAHGHSLGTTFVSLDAIGLRTEFPKDWVVLK